MNLMDIAAALGDRRTHQIAELNGCAVGVSRMTSHPQWERHPTGDELLHVIDGSLHLRVLDGDTSTETEIGPGEVAVVPRGLWHSPQPLGEVTLLYVTPLGGSEISDEADPR